MEKVWRLHVQSMCVCEWKHRFLVRFLVAIVLCILLCFSNQRQTTPAFVWANVSCFLCVCRILKCEINLNGWSWMFDAGICISLHVGLNFHQTLKTHPTDVLTLFSKCSKCIFNFPIMMPVIWSRAEKVQKSKTIKLKCVVNGREVYSFIVMWKWDFNRFVFEKSSSLLFKYSLVSFVWCLHFVCCDAWMCIWDWNASPFVWQVSNSQNQHAKYKITFVGLSNSTIA